MITYALRSSTSLIGAEVGFLPEDISCPSLWSGGVMEILCAKNDPLTIQLLGRCQSNSIPSYLRVQSSTLINDIPSRMLQFGNYHLPTNQYFMAIVTSLE